jgi:hypothetical protein
LNRPCQGFDEFYRDTTEAGKVGRVARLAAEEALGQSVVSPSNFLQEEQAAKKNKRKKRLPASQQGSLFEEQAKQEE